VATLVRPQAIEEMSEIGIDISGQESKTLEGYLGQPFDYVITVCDQARQVCPVFPGSHESFHWGYEDPAEATGTEEERLAVFRSVFTQMGMRINEFVVIARRVVTAEPVSPR
jgi:arsenate reductase